MTNEFNVAPRVVPTSAQAGSVKCFARQRPSTKQIRIRDIAVGVVDDLIQILIRTGVRALMGGDTLRSVEYLVQCVGLLEASPRARRRIVDRSPLPRRKPSIQ